MLTAVQIWDIIIAAGVAIAVIAVLITNTEKVIDFIKKISTKITTAWRAKIVKIYHPLLQDDCAAKKDVAVMAHSLEEMAKVLTRIERELAMNTKGTMRSLGNAINQKCRFLHTQGYASQEERDQLLAEYYDYWTINGNGNILSNVSAVMQLPYVLGGPHNDVDMTLLMERYMETHK